MAHILLIERHRLMRGALKALLERQGAHRIDAASEPVEAVHMVMQSAPQIILLDTSCTEINGVYLSRLLREIAPHAKIVLLVDEECLADEEIRESSRADAFIAKSQLIQKLPALLDEGPLWVEQAGATLRMAAAGGSALQL